MVELTGLNKDYYDAFLATFSAREKEDGKKCILEELEEGGGVIKKEITKEGWPRFFMQNGHTAICAPRGYRFRGPLIPEGMDIKQFELKDEANKKQESKK
jgi:hypothetical protein